jgi:hypothetical protein
LTNGRITLRAIVYPKIGTQVFDTDTQTTIGRQRTQVHRKHPDLFAAPPIAYVSASGNDATGRCREDDAEARSFPFATYNAASTAAIARNNATYGVNALDGCVFRVFDGTNISSASTSRTQLVASPVIEKHPDTVGYQTMNFFSLNLRALGRNEATVPFQSVRVRGFRMVSGTGSMFAISGVGPAATTLFNVDDCEIDFSAATGFSFANTQANNAAWLKNCVFVGGTLIGYLNNTNGRIVGYVGCKNTHIWNQMGILAQSIHGCDFIEGRYTTVSGLDTIIVNTNIGKVPFRTNNLINPDQSSGTCLINLSIEDIGSTERGLFTIAADGFVGNTNHILFWHVSIAGFDQNCRTNLAYNDVRTPGVNNIHNNWSLIGYINEGSVPMKTENFNPTDGSQTGNWGIIFGVDCRGNHVGRAPTSPAAIEYGGPRSLVPGNNRAIFNNPQWVDKQASTDTSGVPTAGGTDFRLQPSSTARNIVMNSPVAFDQEGNPRATSGLSHAGVFA